MAYGNNTFTVTSVTLKQSQRKRRKRRRPSYEELAKRLDEIERTYDEQFEIVIDAIQQLMRPPARKRKPIGFRPRTVRKEDRKSQS